MATGRDRVRSINRAINGPKKEKFITTKMWLSYLVSLTTRDRGTIPENIGNNILITNNMYVTKSFLSVMVQVIELSLDTPVTFLGEMLINELRKEKCSAIVDFTVKNSRKVVDLGDAGLKSRINMWEMSEDNKYLKDNDKRRAIRLLYTIDQVKEGHDLVDSRIFFTIRAKTGGELAIAEKIIYKYLSKVGCVFRPINTSLKDYLEYTTLLCDNRSTKVIKGMSSVVNSEKTLSQMLPNSHSPGSAKGVHIGVNTINNTPFRVDFRNITVARNMYVICGSGGGKTAMVLNMCASASEEGYRLCIMDIKGNEFGTVVDAIGGATISLREKSVEYINSFKMSKEDTNINDCIMYFKSQFSFSKKQMLILSGVRGESQVMQLEGFLDEFLDYVYTSLGVRPDNMNTWHNTTELNPYVIYDYMDKFLNESIKEKYREIIPYLITNLRMYFSRNGSKSYIFTKELNYKELLDLKGIRFDFGMLASSSTYDDTIFRLKFEYMSQINGEYVSKNFNKGLHTFKVLEESQAVSDEVMEAYAREYTLRRAQNQTTVLLGNSVDALVRSKASMPLIETTTCLMIGKLNPPTADLVIKYFDVGNKEGMIRHMSKHNEYLRHFLFINNMETKSLSPILKVQLDPTVESYKILTPSKITD